MNRNINLTWEDTKDDRLPFLDSAVLMKEDGNLNTDQYLLFDSNHLHGVTLQPLRGSVDKKGMYTHNESS